jgi:hypothetical protein
MRVSTKGQVTIPSSIRQKLGILPYTEVIFSIKGNEVILKKDPTVKKRGKDLLKKLTGKASVKMSTEQIMNLTRS